MLFQIQCENMQALSIHLWAKDLELIEKDTENDEISDWGSNANPIYLADSNLNFNFVYGYVSGWLSALAYMR